jgi:hypothetical protein
MRLTILSLLSFIFLLAACGGEEEYEREHATYDFPVEIDGETVNFTYESTHDLLDEPDPDVELVVFVHHGALQNPISYFKNMKAARDTAASNRPEMNFKDNTMIVAPGMIGQKHIEDNPDRYENGNYPYWGGGWRGGSNSKTEPEVSNFELLDSMVMHVTSHFPNVKAVVHAGHSAGGQVVSRYSVGTPIYDDLLERDVYPRYIISNPSSFLYLDKHRPDLETEDKFIDYSDEVPVVDGEECPEFNEYAYGFSGDVVEYMTHRPVDQMIEEFKARDVYLLQGMEDNNPEHGSLDKSCPAMTQGRHRLERGLRYYDYFEVLYGPDAYETKFLETVPGVGHSNAKMFSSDEGYPLIFFDAEKVRDERLNNEQ